MISQYGIKSNSGVTRVTCAYQSQSADLIQRKIKHRKKYASVIKHGEMNRSSEKLLEYMLRQGFMTKKSTSLISICFPSGNARRRISILLMIRPYVALAPLYYRVKTMIAVYVRADKYRM